jgi:hypothetical protein
MSIFKDLSKVRRYMTVKLQTVVFEDLGDNMLNVGADNDTYRAAGHSGQND